MRERVILSTADNTVIDRETRANAIDNTTRARDEGFGVDVCFSANHGKFDLDLFITGAGVVVEGFMMKTIIVDAGAVVEDFMMGAMSFEMLVIRCSSSVFSIADVDI